jgi:hypothetical protein
MHGTYLAPAFEGLGEDIVVRLEKPVPRETSAFARLSARTDVTLNGRSVTKTWPAERVIHVTNLLDLDQSLTRQQRDGSVYFIDLTNGE